VAMAVLLRQHLGRGRLGPKWETVQQPKRGRGIRQGQNEKGGLCLKREGKGSTEKNTGTNTQKGSETQEKKKRIRGGGKNAINAEKRRRGGIRGENDFIPNLADEFARKSSERGGRPTTSTKNRATGHPREIQQHGTLEGTV